MKSMLNEQKIQLVGKHHSGIDDSRNISKIILELLNKDYIILKEYVKNVNKNIHIK